ncbi:thioredoxin domain-containing protein [Allobranchiibius sp. GilTou73]|uniref:thioredoxin domain-containing protein n=1 Tax=Allobranchiibius sp. GilTou73 TaxID=2904523 RepID=UPI001F2C8CAC|nr:thioredoxin domain-containing protein [Allobranchiibius sp. GilTou73]UIJ34842.1 thioredoxin domain-containing protein [Allobranchiibius sp. GilTou73]
MTNRLASATSPYLLQHADNPIDWQEWSTDALDEARRRDVPILLSVGYAACHWCHVMAHETFEDAGVAQIVNAGFVAIKVDREERPDIDAVYMDVTMALTGSGGWPMTCLLTPAGDPFFAGTYLPREQFLRLLDAATQAWTDRRDDVVQSGATISGKLREVVTAESQPVDHALVRRSVDAMARRFDTVNGGFGGAPKFPTTSSLEFLLRAAALTGDEHPRAMAAQTLERMARGGIYDQLGGGFARYSVDARWVVPHFEKMLYDNAQLVRVYAHAWCATGDPLFERVVGETITFMLRELLTRTGAFASSLDADTEGVEGLTYVWTPAQLTDVLGEDDGARAARLLSVTQAGTYEHGASTLQLAEDADVDTADAAWWERTRSLLLEARGERPQPGRDDKVVAAWNGLAIGALAEAGAVFGRRDWIDAASRCARAVRDVHLVEGRLRRTSRDGRVGTTPAAADDLGDLADGLLTLHQVEPTAGWLDLAGTLLDTARVHHRDDIGGFYDAADDAEQLIVRPRSPVDGAEPSGGSALAGALLSYGALTGDPAPFAEAAAAVGAVAHLAGRDPVMVGHALGVGVALLHGPVQVAVVSGERGDGTAGLVEVSWRSTAPGRVTVSGRPDDPAQPLLVDRPMVDGRTAAYVCRRFVCDAPVTTVDALREALGRPVPTSGAAE